MCVTKKGVNKLSDRAKRKQRRLIMRTTILSIIALSIGYVFYTNFIQADTNRVEVGDRAPNFALMNMDGEKVELDDYRGEGVFLNFWGTYCPPCEEEMPYMENQYQLYEDEDIEILAVNVGENEVTVDRFVNRYQLTFPILLDQNRDVLNAYGVNLLPATFLIDEQGEVIKRYIGGMSEQNVIDFMELINPAPNEDGG
ncbi:cytochrome c-type biogenesis protein ResA [Geomicrobium sp. JCM 19055]|nr:cytochrome c-type biogenesis protein ResA [Geomicrobium sp. JCM 19055]